MLNWFWNLFKKPEPKKCLVCEKTDVSLNTIKYTCYDTEGIPTHAETYVCDACLNIERIRQVDEHEDIEAREQRRIPLP